ncbi:MAG: hypothetical protein JWO05_2666 [Gemmatimonadetes bacterium]|nr:hypothetical protein [Gemmatimonadota bacterium]
MTNRHYFLLAVALGALTAPAADAQSSSSNSSSSSSTRTRSSSSSSSYSRSDDEDYVAALDTTVKFDRKGTVSLNIPRGDVIIRSWGRDEVRVHARSDQGAIKFDVSSSRITVDGYGARNHGETDVEVTVPEGVSIIARTQSGDLTVRDTRGAVEAHAQNGDVVVSGVRGRLDVSTFSGDVHVDDVEGDIELSALSGDAHISSAKGDIDVKTVSGDITMEGITAKNVHAQTTSGDVEYDGTIDAQGRYELVSHSGDVSFSVPKGSGAQISVSTWSGDIESDFPITLKPGEHGFGGSSGRKITFEVGNGSARIIAESFSGDITIRDRGTSRGRTDR